MADPGTQLALGIRLLLAAFLGGLIGLERELHEHPAGVRTHLLVAMGAAMFSVLSQLAFNEVAPANASVTTDPSRVAAQIVSGIGFLGAGAILKYGTTVKGLTTAASLWATASIGMAAGTGWAIIAVVGTLIMLASLWPLHVGVQRLRSRSGRSVVVRLSMPDLAPLAAITGEASNRRIEIADLRTEHAGDGRYELALDLRLPPGAVPSEVIQAFARVSGAKLIDARRTLDSGD